MGIGASLAVQSSQFHRHATNASNVKRMISGRYKSPPEDFPEYKRLFSLFLSSSLHIGCAGAATVKTTPRHPVYIGIDQASGSIDGSETGAKYAPRVDLRAPVFRLST